MFIACVFLISELLLSFVIYVIHVWDGFTLLGLLKVFFFVDSSDLMLT